MTLSGCYGDGSGNTKVAVATTTGGTLTTSAGLDSLATIITLTGVDHTLLDSNDYSTITSNLNSIWLGRSLQPPTTK